MKVEELNKILRDLASKHGMCEQVAKEWNTDWEKDKLIEVFLKHIDFYIQTRYVPSELMIEEFGHELLRDSGICVDDVHSFLNKKRTLVIGAGTATVRFNVRHIGEVYALDASSVNVILKGDSFAIIHAYDLADISVKTFDNANALIITHLHGGNIQSEGNVRVREEL